MTLCICYARVLGTTSTRLLVHSVAFAGFDPAAFRGVRDQISHGSNVHATPDCWRG